MKKLFTLALYSALSLSAFAGGYRVSLQGNKQAGMGHTSVSTLDASSIFFNPASMSFYENKGSIVLGGFGINTHVDYQNQQTQQSTSSVKHTGTPFYFGFGYQLGNVVSLGLSVTTPYGNTVEYPLGWPGNNLVNKISLSAIYISPSISFKIADSWSIGATFNYAKGKLDLNRSITSVNGIMDLKGDAKGMGYTVGLYAKPTERLSYTLSYRSKINLKAENQTANFEVPASLVGTPPFYTNQDKFTATLPMVSELTQGISYNFSDKFTANMEINFCNWKEYKSLNIDFAQNTVGNDPNDATISSTPKNFQSKTIFRLGAEYKASDVIAVRAGYYYDPSPVSSAYWSPETPSTNNNAMTFGLGVTPGDKFFMDFSIIGVNGKERYVDNTLQNFSGDVKSDAFVFGLGIGYKF